MTRKLGYREDGVEIRNRLGRRATERRFRLERTAFSPATDIEIRNLDACLPLFIAPTT
ncbi:hypothetical protein [Nonomuraea recticatena]|uniref:hypothetical protein n=1 Tax=Nonomuraea recticatena TaxID=46178 RepID=UPI00360FFCA6